MVQEKTELTCILCFCIQSLKISCSQPDTCKTTLLQKIPFAFHHVKFRCEVVAEINVSFCYSF